MPIRCVAFKCPENYAGESDTCTVSFSKKKEERIGG